MSTTEIFFSSMSGESGKPVQATPLKIMMGEYEISLAGDNSCGALGTKLSRLDIAVFRNGETIEHDIYISTFEELIEVVEKYRKITSPSIRHCPICGKTMAETNFTFECLNEDCDFLGYKK